MTLTRGARVRIDCGESLVLCGCGSLICLLVMNAGSDKLLVVVSVPF